MICPIHIFYFFVVYKEEKILEYGGGMLMKLYLDPGHGGSDPGSQGNGLSEKDVVLEIAKRIRSILLNDYENVEVKMSHSSECF